MIIAIDVSQVVYEGTGVARYTTQLVEHLIRIPSDHMFILFGYSLGKKDVLDGWIRRMESISPRVLGKTFPIPQTCGNILWNRLHIVPVESLIGSVDIFHSSDWIQPPCRAKKITTVHDAIVFRYESTSHPHIVSTQKKRLHWVQRECDHIIVDSQSTEDDLVTYLSIPKDRMTVVYPGVEDRFFSSNTKHWNQIQKKYGLPDTYILSVGAQEPRKNLHRLIDAYQVLTRRATYHVPPLVLAGKHAWGDRVKEPTGVIRLGYVSDEDLPSIYRHACMFSFLSLYEGFGLPVLEAMASGCPIVTSNRGSLKEVVADAAVIVDPEDVTTIALAMENLMRDTTIRMQYKAKGIERAKSFTWANTAQKMMKVYTQLLPGS